MTLSSASDHHLAPKEQRYKVDLCVVTWNTGEFTAPMLRDVLDADHGCDLRVLVRDNASSDGTPEVIARLVPEADVDVGNENIGFAAGVNTLIARSTAPWIFLLNADAWPLAGAVRALVKAAERHPRAAAVAPRLENPNGTLQHSTHPFPSVRVAALAALGYRLSGQKRSERYLLNGAWMHDRPREVDWAIGAALLLRREAVQDIGGFDERFFMYAEDLEWCWRGRRRGWLIWFEPSAVVRHVANMSGARRYGNRRTRTHIRNSYRFYRSEHSLPSTIGWWGLQLAGVGARYVSAIARRDRSAAATWREHTKSYLLALTDGQLTDRRDET
jgi:GT2 family glycosyltransferase